MTSAPARLRHMSDSSITFSSSIIFKVPPALIIEYSPETYNPETYQHRRQVHDDTRHTKSRYWVGKTLQDSNAHTKLNKFILWPSFMGLS